MLQVIVRLVAVLIVLLGIVLVYDARLLTKRFFGFGDQNEASQRIKDIGIYYSYCGRANFIFCLKLLDK